MLKGMLASWWAPYSSFALCTGRNPLVRQENSKSGFGDWYLTKTSTNNEIVGYASSTSINRGETIQFYIHSIDPTYTLEVFRFGWYGGMGARRITGPITLPGRRQVMPTPDPETQMTECNWQTSYTLRAAINAEDPTSWMTGIYFLRLTSLPSGYQSYVPFVVRDDAREADLLFQQAVSNYQAYNMWGGANLYGGVNGRATKVSFNRPYKEGAGLGEIEGGEIQMLRFLEREGYDVKYATSVDLHRQSLASMGAKAFLSIGHDEYWSWQMRSHAESGRDQGVHLAFFSANTCYRQIRFERSLITGANNRTIVCYKEPMVADPRYTEANTRYLTTTFWRESPVSRPEDSMIGIMYDDTLFPSSGDMVISNPNHWVFQGTGLRSGDKFKGLLNGREVDRVHPTAPKGIEILCTSPVSVNGAPANPDKPSHVTMYTAASGAKVFAAGTFFWSYALDDFGQSARSDIPTDSRAQIATRNLLDRFIQCT
jgi:hypothetical protein